MLPKVLIEKIMMDLGVGDVIRMSTCCKNFNKASKSGLLWQHLAKRDFHKFLVFDGDDFENERGWISCYIYCYQHCYICNSKFNKKNKKEICIECQTPACKLCCKQSGKGMCGICLVKKKLKKKKNLLK